MNICKNVVIRAFTDGACKKNPGIGGWGWTAKSRQCDRASIIWQDWGGKHNTTNQQMELRAMREFLEFCPKGFKAEIWSDSRYTLNGIVGNCPTVKGDTKSKLVKVDPDPQGWMKKWKNYNINKCYKRKFSMDYWNKVDLKNSEEWYLIHQLLIEHSISGSKLYFGWVKGHSDCKGNQIADELANRFPCRVKSKTTWMVQ